MVRVNVVRSDFDYRQCVHDAVQSFPCDFAFITMAVRALTECLCDTESVPMSSGLYKNASVCDAMSMLQRRVFIVKCSLGVQRNLALCKNRSA